ncbi:MAG TPA: SH3 domain-containing protein [Sphingomonadaceae bacterium]|nr:SH3 domain-containing protein [Sphingomonadaceae bacterium]
MVRWNDGYYFTRCRRCGLDLVRTAFSGWTAPKRYRVVWQAEPPASVEQVGSVPQAEAEPPSDATSASEMQTAPASPEQLKDGQVEFPIRENIPAPAVELSMTEEAFAARPAEDESLLDDARSEAEGLQGRKDDGAALPIQDVLQSLRPEPETPAPTPRSHHRGEEEAHVDRGADFLEERLPSPPTPPRVRYPVIPDFMDEEFPGITWDPSTGRMISDDRTNSKPASPEARPGWRDAIRGKAQAATASGLELLRTRTADTPAPPENAAEPSPPPRTSVPSRSFLERHGGLVAATVFGGFVLAAAMVDRGPSGGDRIAYRPELRTQDAGTRPAPVNEQRIASVAARPSTASDVAFVTASLLNCRAVPADDGETVRRLSRGDAVKVLGADPGWVSVSHQGRQCWASRQWISTVKPL